MGTDGKGEEKLFLPRSRTVYTNHLKKIFFVLGYSQLANNVVIGPGEQRRDSAEHIHVSFFSPKLPSHPVQAAANIEQSPMCYTVGPCCPPTTFISSQEGGPGLGEEQEGPSSLGENSFL